MYTYVGVLRYKINVIDTLLWYFATVIASRVLETANENRTVPTYIADGRNSVFIRWPFNKYTVTNVVIPCSSTNCRQAYILCGVHYVPHCRVF